MDDPYLYVSGISIVSELFAFPRKYDLAYFLKSPCDFGANRVGRPASKSSYTSGKEFSRLNGTRLRDSLN